GFDLREQTQEPTLPGLYPSCTPRIKVRWERALLPEVPESGLAARQRSGDGLLQALGKAPALHQMAREIERRVGLPIKDHPHPNAVIVQDAPVEIERSITLSNVWRRLTRWYLAQHRERPDPSGLMRTPAARVLSVTVDGGIAPSTSASKP